MSDLPMFCIQDFYICLESIKEEVSIVYQLSIFDEHKQIH